MNNNKDEGQQGVFLDKETLEKLKLQIRKECLEEGMSIEEIKQWEEFWF